MLTGYVGNHLEISEVTRWFELLVRNAELAARVQGGSNEAPSGVVCLTQIMYIQIHPHSTVQNKSAVSITSALN